MRKFGLIAIVIPLIGSCASYGMDAPTLAPTQLSMIDSTCNEIMGLHRGEYYYQMCQESLGNSLTGKLAAEGTARGWTDCRNEHLAPGSADFAACVLQRQTSPSTSESLTPTAAKLVYPRDELQSSKSYYRVTNAIHWKREQYSCAQLGLEPGSNAFAQCVASLDASLLPPG